MTDLRDRAVSVCVDLTELLVLNNEDDGSFPADSATSTGVITSRSGNDHYDGSVTYRNRLAVVRFECSVCGLELVDEAEVMAAGLPTAIAFRTHVYVDGFTVFLPLKL